MKQYFLNLFDRIKQLKGYKYYKKIIGALAVFVGLIALVTPLTPGASFLIFIGLQLLGIHIAFIDEIEEYFKNFGKKKTKDNYKNK